MQKFVAEQNIQRFKERLAQETDEVRRKMLLDMIAVEEARLKAAREASEEGTHPSPSGPDPKS